MFNGVFGIDVDKHCGVTGCSFEMRGRKFLDAFVINRPRLTTSQSVTTKPSTNTGSILGYIGSTAAAATGAATGLMSYNQNSNSREYSASVDSPSKSPFRRGNNVTTATSLKDSPRTPTQGSKKFGDVLLVQDNELLLFAEPTTESGKVMPFQSESF
jgi:hypothetical protein